MASGRLTVQDAKFTVHITRQNSGIVEYEVAFNWFPSFKLPRSSVHRPVTRERRGSRGPWQHIDQCLANLFRIMPHLNSSKILNFEALPQRGHPDPLSGRSKKKKKEQASPTKLDKWAVRTKFICGHWLNLTPQIANRLLPKSKLIMCKKTFAYSAAHFWNTFLSKFKSNIHTFNFKLFQYLNSIMCRFKISRFLIAFNFSNNQPCLQSSSNTSINVYVLPRGYCCVVFVWGW